MNLVDTYCASLFPELETFASKAELEDASKCGSYIFHEDYFMPLVFNKADDAAFLRRVANYIEYLASDQNTELNNLAEVGLLGSIVNKNFHVILHLLGKNSRYFLAKTERYLKHSKEIKRFTNLMKNKPSSTQ